MASKKNSNNSLLIAFGIFVAAVLVGGAYLFGTQKLQTFVQGATTTPTKAGEVASAAYAKCVQNGGFVTTARRPNNGFYNICNFEDDMNCELYALYNGECPVGGVKTVGYSTTDQVYCALRGGTPQGSNNGQCKMPDGKVCSTASVYNGTCDPN